MSLYQWDMALSYGDSVAALENPLPELLDVLLQEIYGPEGNAGEDTESNAGNGTGRNAEKTDYSLDLASLETNIREQAERITSKWNRTPTNAQLTGRDKEKGSWIYSDGEKGIRIDQEEALQEIEGVKVAMCSEKTKDGTVIEEEYFHTSTYKGKPGVVKRNTSGVVVPAETAESVPSESIPIETFSMELPTAESTQVEPFSGIGQ